MKNLTVGSDERDKKTFCYISARGRSVSSIVLYTIISNLDGDVWLGAYYGYVGGGVNDGGYFRIDIEGSSSVHFDFEEINDLSETSELNHVVLEGLMIKIWTLVEEDEGELLLTDIGVRIFSPEEDGVWMDEEFDGDTLDDISTQWRIQLHFKS